jgi:hypothetical protein
MPKPAEFYDIISSAYENTVRAHQAAIDAANLTTAAKHLLDGPQREGYTGDKVLALAVRGMASGLHHLTQDEAEAGQLVAASRTFTYKPVVEVRGADQNLLAALMAPEYAMHDIVNWMNHDRESQRASLKLLFELFGFQPELIFSMATHIAMFFEHVARCEDKSHSHCPAVILYIKGDHADPPSVNLKGLH